MSIESLSVTEANKQSTIIEAETYLEDTEYNKSSIHYNNAYAYSMGNVDSRPKHSQRASVAEDV